MGEIVLVRHGQANSAARDEENYDRLSELGRRQSAWLGEWLAVHDDPFDLHLAGALRRHRQTAEAMGVPEDTLRIDPRLNELDYFNLGHALEATHGVPLPTQDEFPTHVPQVMEAWHRAEIAGNESFEAFENRVAAGLLDAAQEGRRVLAVTSGGVIAMVMRRVLGLDPRRLARVMLPIRNTSIHRLHVVDGEILLVGFNATPHLDPADRADARTIY